MDAFDNRSLKWLCAQIASMDYAEALELQRRLVSARIAGNLDRNAVLVLEHSPVFTLGRRGGRESLKVPENFLKQSGIPVVQVERGGTITYHGPGQLVVYPIVRLRDLKMRVADYVERLEAVMILTAADLGVQAERNALNRGVWVENRKLGSIGVAIRRGVSFHGLALNVDPSLAPFEWVHPCGLQGIRMTSISKERAGPVSMTLAREVLTRRIEDVFGVQLVMTDLKSLP